ncbi:F-box domain-containing protein [Fusarium oxysporum f. sp. phaseoli]
MIACRIVAVIGLLAAGVQAGPCKPSSVVTTTADATSTYSVSNTGTATSGDIATTTETTLTPSSTGYSCVNNEKTPFPAGVLCDTKGIGADPNMLTVVMSPNVFCDLWGGRIQGTDGSNTDFSWYSLDCFCDLPELSTTSATATAATATTGTTSLTTDTAITNTATMDTTILTSETATTELETSSTVLTTSSAALTSSTETTTAAATTTTIATSAPSCPGGFPSGSSCGVSKQYIGTGSYIKDIDGTYTLDECLQFCIDHPTCNLFAYAATWCELWNGEYATTGSSVNFSCTYEWSSLPVELRLQIFGYVAEQQKYRATHLSRWTCVSSEWQDYFEEFTFRRLLIDNSQLARFFKVTKGEKALRLSYIRYPCLRIKIHDYDYPECDKAESHATINW